MNNEASTEQIRIWAERVKRSDRVAFDNLFQTFYPRLVYFANRYTRDMDDARDLVQDVFIKLWKKRKHIEPEQSLKSYLYKMTRNRALNHMRDYRNRRLPLEELNRGAEDTDRTVHSDSEIRDRPADGSELAEQFRNWIQQLPDRRRTVFELSRYEGLDHDEIAEVLDVSPKTVNNHIVAALQQLRDRYRSYKETKP